MNKFKAINFLLFIIFCFFSVVISGDIKSPSILNIETEFGYFNASFWWNIKRLHLHDFGSIDDTKVLKSPIFNAIDYSDSNKEYQAQFEISTIYNEGILSSYSVEAKWGISPTSFTFCYKIIGEEWNCPIENPFTLELTAIKKKLDFEIKFYMDAIFNKNQEMNTPTKIYPPTLPYNGNAISLRNELLKMFDEDETAKFIIESGGEEITAYKPIMQSRSPIFKELLLNGTDRLRITDFQPKVIQKMIEFCNNDTIENFEYEETSLFAIAYDYKIKSLMAHTSGHIASTATIENAVARFKFAHFYGYESLKKWFFDFIIRNFVEVSKTSAFKTLDTVLYKPFLEELLKENKIH